MELVRKCMTKRVKAPIQNAFSMNNVVKNANPKFCFLLLFVVTLFSCSEKRRVITSYPIEKELVGKRLVEFDSLYNAYGVSVFGDDLVFSLIHSDDFLYVYDMQNHKGHYSIRKGHGNDEMLAPLVTGQQLEINGKDFVCIQERGTNILYGVDLSSMATNMIKIADFSANSRKQSIIYAYKTSDKSYIGSSVAESSKLFVYKDNKMVTIQPPLVDSTMFEANKFELSQTRSTYSDVQGKMATGYFSFPMVIITDNRGENNVTIQLDGEMPKYTKANREAPYQYIIDICSTEEHFFVLYDNPNNAKQMEILVFSWDGSPVAKYSVPRLTCFTIDKKAKRFVGLMEDDKDGVCCEFLYDKAL